MPPAYAGSLRGRGDREECQVAAARSPGGGGSGGMPPGYPGAGDSRGMGGSPGQTRTVCPPPGGMMAGYARQMRRGGQPGGPGWLWSRGYAWRRRGQEAFPVGKADRGLCGRRTRSGQRTRRYAYAQGSRARLPEGPQGQGPRPPGRSHGAAMHRTKQARRRSKSCSARSSTRASPTPRSMTWPRSWKGSASPGKTRPRVHRAAGDLRR